MSDLYRPSPTEIAWGAVYGQEPVDWSPGTPTESPIEALRALLLPLLEQPPCFVSFSGGRDSSALLAVAVDLARGHSLPEPVPLTQVFPGNETASEDEWQELVIRHLKLGDWVRLDYTEHGGLFSPDAQMSLRRFGLLWPATAHTKHKLYEAARGGSLVSGNGGDEVFGRRRITPLSGLVARNVRPRRRALAAVLREAAPASVRSRSIAAQRARTDDRSWLTDDERERFLTTASRDAAAQPLRWYRSIHWHATRRSHRLGIANLNAIARDHGVRLATPFLDSAFIRSFAANSLLGPPGRGAAMRQVFGDLLPSDILTRSTKAEFRSAVIDDAVRDHLRTWSGGGIDESRVSAPRLREVWSQDDLPPAGTLLLAQATWLAGSRNK